MKEYKKIIIIGIFTVVTILGAILISGLINNGVFSKKKDTEKETTTTITTTINSSESSFSDSIKPIVVEIKGEVYYPGVYEFYKEEVVVQDVINIAGGLTKKADTSLINLAEAVSDHSSIIIGTYDTVSYVLGENESVAKININTCTIDELIKLDGIGDTKAKNIINYRKQNGFFSSIEDIKNVEGIGESVYQKIKDNITV